ncbi:glucosaminidase domain-containing protein [Lentilactobacillus parafarraginis]
MMAQAIVESDFGQSTLSTDANNYFGIKARMTATRLPWKLVNILRRANTI